jgi:predicted dehydrogenase
VGASLVPAFFRFVGTEGVLELDPDDGDADLRWRGHGDADWERRSFADDEWTDPISDAIADVVRCVETGEEPTLSARNALNSAEVIFGIWESARRRGRVDFPLERDDNPLHDMVESGALDPEPADEDGD